MDTEKKNEIAQVADVKLLSGRAHEYVVNFRNRFLTYFALPLFLLFIALALVISWMVYVPARSEYLITLDNTHGQTNIQLKPKTVKYLQFNADKVKTAHIMYTRSNGTLTQFSVNITHTGSIEINGPTPELNVNGSIEATLVLFINEDRFIFKLLDELAKNLKVKKPASIEPDRP